MVKDWVVYSNMAVYPQILEDVIDFYKKLPGIGEILIKDNM